jgi:hypothetical protein
MNKTTQKESSNKDTNLFSETADTSDMAIVIWNQPNILSIGGPDRGMPILGRINPGVNKIPKSLLYHIKNHPILKFHVDEKELEIIEDGELNYDKMTARQVDRVVRMTLDEEELTKLTKHKRKEVVKAAKETLTKLQSK